MKRIYILSILCILAACTTSKSELDPNWNAVSSVQYISYSSTVCFGTCPLIDIFFFEDGMALYRYQYFTGQSEGLSEPVYEQFNLGSEQFGELLRFMESNNVYDLADDYNYGTVCKEWWTDDKSVAISLNSMKENKRITHYEGCKVSEAHESLNLIKKKIEEVLQVDLLKDRLREKATSSRNK